MKFSHMAKFTPAILWMGLIFYLSSKSTAGVGYTGIERFVLFKALHIIEYAILVVLVIYPITNEFFSIVISYIYAITDEIHQGFTPGRSPKFSDTMFDLAGILIGILLFRLVKKHFKKTKNKLH